MTRLGYPRARVRSSSMFYLEAPLTHPLVGLLEHAQFVPTGHVANGVAKIVDALKRHNQVFLRFFRIPAQRTHAHTRFELRPCLADESRRSSPAPVPAE